MKEACRRIQEWIKKLPCRFNRHLWEHYGKPDDGDIHLTMCLRCGTGEMGSGEDCPYCREAFPIKPGRKGAGVSR